MTIPNDTPADEQAVHPRQATCYNSKYLAEYYDLWIGTWNDVQLYSRLLAEMLARRNSSDDPVRVLDVGTGSGRIIHGLATAQQQGKKGGTSQPAVHFLGLDNEQHMLDRAHSLTHPAHVDQITWVLGSAEDLVSLPALQSPGGPGGIIDMIVFACGSICHLHEPAQGHRFFEQMAKVLKPTTGRAYISVLEALTDGGEPLARAMEPSEPILTPSKEFPGIMYRETWPLHKLVGNVWHTHRHIVVSQKSSDGPETIVEDNLDVRKVKVWTEADMRAYATAAGLQVVQILHHHNDSTHKELIFVFGTLA
ncbi:hypothetical protein ASPBRDRAFT_47703 [Aspergillus brasiliensis CBS 101740]|uniref:Methyltransferase domain-containing protein n=1 Tax=Aspergillus brasiliensis (strain CBS 101740 / IMI 381727 / IBT 21946) TaxID=767769 RepID=A0A1L9U7M5_ASPBC|nr:hypothetical protein ASPBRDRAFT_47703 [Aspergillus brasiliensis CBS 101740]